MRLIGRIIPGIVLLVLLTLASELLACPNCKEAVANQDGDSMRLANGYSWSILLMIGTPFTLLGTGMVMIVRAVKRGGFPEL